MKREQVVAELRRHPFAKVVRKSGLSSAEVYKYMYDHAVSADIEARLESFARESKALSIVGHDPMNREQVVEELLRHPIKRVIRESGLPSDAVNRYLCGKAVLPYMEMHLESYARKVKRSSPSIVGDEPMKREQIVAELLRHPVGYVARESGVSYPTVRKYLRGEDVRPYIEARLEAFAREVAK